MFSRARFLLRKTMARRTRLQDASTEEAKFNILNPSASGQDDSQPGSLQQHCRTFILQSVGLQRLAKIVELPLPQTMINFLANQLTVDDFYVNRNNLNSEHLSHCVYPAKCLLDMSEVLLKCVPPCLADDQVKAALEAWRGVSHPNLMHDLVHFSQEGTEIIVFEYPPITLVDVLCQHRELHKTLPEYLIWKAFCELCSVIKYLNEKGILYESMKPTERISFNEGGALKLDSGLLYMPSHQDNMNAMALGDNVSGVYSPPEVLTGQQFSAESQVWLLGCLLYEFVMLEPAYKIQGTDMFTALANIMEGRAPPEITANYSDALKATIRECLTSDSQQRPSVEELVNRATVNMEGLKAAYEGPDIANL